MVGAPTVQCHSELGGSEGNLCGELLGHIQAPWDPWDLKNYRQKAKETLRGYIWRFSRRCNELPNVVDIDMIGAFLSGTTCESLVHKLGHKGP